MADTFCLVLVQFTLLHVNIILIYVVLSPAVLMNSPLRGEGFQLVKHIDHVFFML